MHKILQPVTLKELADALSQDGRKILAAGGTDLLIRVRMNPPKTATVIDLSHMEALRQCSRNGTGLRIGAMCTMTELSLSSLIQSAAGVLAQAASMVGSTQIRNRATVGGNVANAAQCADTIPALIALDADVELMNSQGALRSIKVEEFVTGIGKTLITEQEAVTGFTIPNCMLDQCGGYGKIGSRKTVTIAKVNGAAVVKLRDGKVESARVAFGSLGQRGFYSRHVSQGLAGMTVEELEREEYLNIFVEQVEQAIPGRDSLTYKRSAVKAVASDIIGQLIAAYRGC